MTEQRADRPCLIITTSSTDVNTASLRRLRQYYEVKEARRSGFFDTVQIVSLVFTGMFSYFLGKGLDLLLAALREMLSRRQTHELDKEEPLILEIEIFVEDVSERGMLRLRLPMNEESSAESLEKLEALRDLDDPRSHHAYVETSGEDTC